jgi:hypothetical protein
VSDDAGPDRRPHRPPPTERFGPYGWVLLAALGLALIVAPVVIFVRPPGIPFEMAFLILPLLPAGLLAIVAVWSAVRARGQS